jgi:hypothetical protein
MEFPGWNSTKSLRDCSQAFSRFSSGWMVPRESAKADFGPLLPRIYSPGEWLKIKIVDTPPTHC